MAGACTEAVHSARSHSNCVATAHIGNETLSNISKLNVQLEWQLLMNFDSLTTTLNFATGIFCLLTG